MESDIALINCIKKIMSKFNHFNVQRAVFWDEESQVSKLKGKAKKEFLQDYAEFWHTFSTLNQMVSRLHFCIRKMTELSDQVLNELRMEKNGGSSDHYEMGVILSDNFFQYVYILVTMFEDLKRKKFNINKFKKEFPELFYVRRLRNEFIQHIQLDAAYQNSSTTCEFRDDQLPLYHCWPGAIGIAIISKYHLSQIKGSAYLRKGHNIQALLNKKYFLSKKGERKNRSNNFIHRLNVHGLPSVNQKQLAKDLTNFFTKMVIPFIEVKIKTARKKNIII